MYLYICVKTAVRLYIPMSNIMLLVESDIDHIYLMDVGPFSFSIRQTDVILIMQEHMDSVEIT